MGGLRRGLYSVSLRRSAQQRASISVHAHCARPRSLSLQCGSGRLFGALRDKPLRSLRAERIYLKKRIHMQWQTLSKPAIQL